MPSLVPLLLFLGQAVDPSAVFQAARPAVTCRVGDAGSLTVDVRRADLAAGITLQAHVTNDGSTPVQLAALELCGGLAITLPHPPQDARVLTLAADGTCALRSAGSLVESQRLIGLADAAGGHAIVVGSADPMPVPFALSLDPAADGGWLLWARIDSDATLDPGQTWHAPNLTLLAPESAQAGLEQLLPPAGREGSSDLLAPIVLEADADSGAKRVTRNPRGRALDLFRSPGTCLEWLAADATQNRLVLINPTAAPALHTIDVATVSGATTCLLTDARSQRVLGRHHERMTLAVAAADRREFDVLPAEIDPPTAATGFEVLLVAAAADGTSSAVEIADGDDPQLTTRIEATLDHGGTVIANHRGVDPLHPLPAALDSLLIARIFPCHPATVRLARGRAEERFLTQAAKVQWPLAFQNAELKTATAWLCCLEAGFYATPLQGVLADALPAARGFAIHTNPGLVLVTMNLTAAERDELVRVVSDRSVRHEVLRNIGQATVSMRRSVESGGLYRQLKLDRLRPTDLVPADPHVLDQWTIALPARRQLAIESHPNTDGDWVTEELVRFDGSLLFVADLPNPREGSMVLVVRTAPGAHRTGYRLSLNDVPVGETRYCDVAGPAADPPAWCDDVVVLTAADTGQQQRATLAISSVDGAIALARIGMFRHLPKEGDPLSRMDPVRVDLDPALAAAGIAPRRDRSSGDHVLRLGDTAYLSGLGLRPGMRFEYALDERYLSLLARVGIDAECPAGGLASFRIEVDGAVRFSSDKLLSGKEPQTVTIDLRGARRLLIEVGGEGDAPVSLIEPRLIRR